MDPSSEKSEHVLWQTSSQESREFIPQTPKVLHPYEDSVDFTSVLLDKYEPVLGSSPPATWHPQATNQTILPQQSATQPGNQPGKRVLSDFGGRFYRYSPGNIKGHVRPPSSGSPNRKRQKDGETLEDDSLDTLREQTPGLEPLKLEPDSIPIPQVDFSDSEDEIAQHPDLEIHWKRATFIRLVVYSRQDSKLWCRHDTGFCTVILTKSWTESHVKQGDILHIVSGIGNPPPQLTPTITIDNNVFLIVNPDVLVPATTIAEAFSCDRQVLLRQRVRFPSSDVSLPMVYGNILHEAIQRCIVDYEMSETKLKESFAELIEAYLEDLAFLDTAVEDALAELHLRIPQLVAWAKRYMVSKPTNTIEVYRYKSSNMDKLPKFTILGPKFTELELWSPQWGILGKLDCVVEAATQDGVKLAGLEIKTGKSHTNSHRMQCALYSLLMVERFGGQALSWTALYYSQYADVSAIPVYPDEVRALMQTRNKLVRYMNDPFSLAPPLMGTEETCKYCFVRPACSKYAAAYQELDFLNDDLNPSVEQQIQQDTNGLTGSHLEFIEHWDTALTHEQVESASKNKQIWLKSPQAREESLQSLVGLKIKALKQTFTDGLTTKYLYELHRPSHDFPPNTLIHEGSPIYISSFRNVLLSTAYVRTKTANTIQVVSNHKISSEPGLSLTVNNSKNFMAYSRGNLIQLFDKPRLVELIVDLKAPQFEPVDFVCPITFNRDQRNAIEKALSAKDYAIIRGMPGTGKTTTIVSLAQILASQGKTVLLAGYTNSSVDNLVLKLMRKNTSILRLGNSPTAIHKEVLEVAACKKTPRNRAELDEIYMTPQIIATTSLSLSSWILQARRFDYCIVDEASQLTLPAILGTLGFADKFVLVGDDYQLNPIVKSEAARQAGLRVSLFERLAKAHPEAVVNLSMQYRMNSEIMRLSSELVYDGLLQCATPEVAQQKLKLSKLSPFHTTPPWLDNSRSVVFVNTDSLADAGETMTTEGHFNSAEVKLAKEMVQGFVKHGLNPTQIGVISEYKRQVHALEMAINPIQPGVEVLTADKAQGRDKQCIIISLVRSNDNGKVGLLLKDWRRINVVFTRAKCKLVIIGSRKTLKSAAPLERFIRLIEVHNWIVDAQ